MTRRRVVFLAGATVSIVLTALLISLFSSAATAAEGAATFTWADDFDTTTLDSRWSWVREDPTHWSLSERPGFLRITTQQGGLVGPGGDTPNLLLQGTPPGDFTVETRLLFTPTENFHSAGLLLYEDDDNFLALSRTFCQSLPLPSCVGNAVGFAYEDDGVPMGADFVVTTTVPGEAYLRVKRVGNAYTGSVSIDGNSWITVGVHTVADDFRPTGVGLGVVTGYQDVTEIPADFDYFLLEDDSVRLFLPAVNKP